MKPRMFTAFVLVASLALLLAVSTSAQRSDRPIAPPSPGDMGPQSVNAPAISLGQPGTSFRYVQTFGVTEAPYISDTAHLNFPMGIATDGTNVLIGEFWGHRVLKYTSAGTFVSSLGQAPISMANSDGDISRAFDMAVDSGGNTWVADSGSDRVSKFDASGAYLGSFKEEGTFGQPAGIAFDGSGNVYVSEGSEVGTTFWNDGIGHQRIQIYDSAGNYQSTIGITDTSGSDNNHFFGPQHIAVYSNTLYVADKGNHRIQIFDISTPASPVYSATIGVASASGNDTAHLDNPIGVAVDSNYIYVADSGNNRVQVFSRATRAYVATIGAGYGTDNDHFNNPTDVAVDSTGNIYVADFANCRVQQFNSSRVYQRTYGVTGVPYLTDGYHYNVPSGVAVASDGSIYLTEEAGQRLVKLNAAGTPQWTVGIAGVRGSTNDRLNDPKDVALDAAGRVYVAEGDRVQIFNPSGTYSATLGGGTGNYQFYKANGLTIAENGYIYVADRGWHRVQIFDANRNYVATLGERDVSGSDNTHFNGPQDVAVDGNGYIYVADKGNQRVQVFDSNRAFLRTIGVTGVRGNDFGHLWYPTAITVDANGRTYVADQLGGRVQVFDNSGAYLATICGSNLTGQLRGVEGLAVDSAGNLYTADVFSRHIQKFALGVPGWKQANINGFGDRNNGFIYSLATFGGQLYAGTSNSSNGAQLWRKSESGAWTAVITNGFGYAQNIQIGHLIEFSGNLYAGTANWDNAINDTHGGEIWRSSNGLSWTRVVSQGFGDPVVNGGIFRFAVLSNTLYAGTSSYTNTRGAQIWQTSDGLSWTNTVTNGFGNANNGGIDSFEVFNGYLYAGTGSSGGELWRSDGTSWNPVKTGGFGNANNTDIASLAEFNGYLYAGTRNPSQGGELWRSSNGLDWTAVFTSGLGNAANGRLYGLIASNNRLYLVFSNLTTGAEVWRSADGSTWERVAEAGWGDSNNQLADYFDRGAAVFNNSLYIGTSNSVNGGGVWRMDETQVPVSPGLGAVLIYTGTLNTPTTVITVPPGAVTQAITLTYMPLQSVTPPAGLGFAGYAFDLDAYQNGSLLLGVEFSTPVTVTLRYTDADVAGMSEANLKLYTYSGGAWQDAACGAYDRHPDQNWLSAPICHLSRFALFEVKQYQVYLPVVIRN